MRTTLLEALRGLRSFADGDAVVPHFKGNPQYVLEEGQHGKRWHLAHPHPEVLADHLAQHAEGAPRSPLTLFGWQHEAHDGSRFPGLDQGDSAHFADLWGVANPESLKARLTGGLPELQDAHLSCFLSDGSDEIDHLASRLEHYHDGDISHIGDGVIERTQEEEHEDEDTGEVTSTTLTDYWNEDHDDWQDSPYDNRRPEWMTATAALSHPRLGDMKRVIYGDYEGSGEKIAEQAYWQSPGSSDTDDNTGRQGLSGLLYQSQFEAYRAAGCDAAIVHANINVGGYAWAMHGFDTDDVDSLRERVKDELESLHQDHGHTTDDFDPDDLDLPLSHWFAEDLPGLDPKTATEEQIRQAMTDEGLQGDPQAYLDWAHSVQAGRDTPEKYGAHLWDTVMRPLGHEEGDFQGPTQVKNALAERDSQIEYAQGHHRRRKAEYLRQATAHAEASAFRAANPDPQAWIDAQVAAGSVPELQIEHFAKAHQELQAEHPDLQRSWLTLHPDLLPELRAQASDRAAQAEADQIEAHLPVIERGVQRAHELARDGARGDYWHQYVDRAAPADLYDALNERSALALLKRHPTADSLAQEHLDKALDIQTRPGSASARARSAQAWLDQHPDHTVSFPGLPEEDARAQHEILVEDARKRIQAAADFTAGLPASTRAQAEQDHADALALIQGPPRAPSIPDPGEYTGDQKTEGWEDDAIVRHWIDTQGWQPGAQSADAFTDEALSQHLDEIDDIDSAPQLARYTIPQYAGLDRKQVKVGKQGLLGSDWYGRHDLMYKTRGDAYRAGKIASEYGVRKGEAKPDAPADPAHALLGTTPLASIQNPASLHGVISRGGRTLTPEQLQQARGLWDAHDAQTYSEASDRNVWDATMMPATEPLDRAGRVFSAPAPDAFDQPGEVLSHAELAQGRLLDEAEVHPLIRHFHRVTGRGLAPLTGAVNHTPESAWERAGRPLSFVQTRGASARLDLRPLVEQHLDAHERDEDAAAWQRVYGDEHPRATPYPERGQTVALRARMRQRALDEGLSEPEAQAVVPRLSRHHARHHLLGTAATPEGETWERWFRPWAGSQSTNPTNSAMLNSPRGGHLDQLIADRRGPQVLSQYPLDERPGDEARLHQHQALAALRHPETTHEPSRQALAHRAITGTAQPTARSEAQLREQARQLGLRDDEIDAALAHHRRSTR